MYDTFSFIRKKSSIVFSPNSVGETFTFFIYIFISHPFILSHRESNH
jgi:hypothetical protein